MVENYYVFNELHFTSVKCVFLECMMKKHKFWEEIYLLTKYENTTDKEEDKKQFGCI